jgi:hypothetical protein
MKSINEPSDFSQKKKKTKSSDNLEQFAQQRKLQNKVLKKMVEELHNQEESKTGKTKT